MGSRFLISLISAFFVTLTILAGSGYAISQLSFRHPRDPYRTAAFEFNLASGWSCELDGTEHVCVPPGKAPRSAIAVIAMKERNLQDNLEAYKAHLQKPQRNDSIEKASLSEVRYVKRRRLGEREWVEALHLSSEIADYETYYLATATSNLGILVTMSVQKDHATEYIQQLTEMMDTLDVYQR